MKHLIFVATLILAALVSFGQIMEEPELELLLRGKGTFNEIKATVEDFYITKLSKLSPGDATEKKRLSRKRKFWNRYLYEAESHLDGEGKMVNAAKRTLEYLSANPSLSSRVQTSAGSWSLAGPTSVATGIGRINRIAFDPSNPAVIYAGSSGGGLFKTENAGISWSSVTSFLPSLGISGIVVVNSNTIYILTGDGDAESSRGFTFSSGYIRYASGVLKSTDGGDTWQQTANFPGIGSDLYNGMQLVRDPNNANVLLAATTRGLFRTTNGGGSWALCNVGSNLTSDDEVMVYDVKFAPGQSNIVYCAIRNGNASNDGRFLRSTDGGINFPFTNTVAYSPNSFTSVQRISIGVTADDAGVVYLLAGPGSPAANTFRGVWRSDDSGANFTRQSNAPNVIGRQEDTDYPDQNMYDLALAVSPSNSRTVIAGGLVIFKSTNSGVLFGQTTPYSGSESIHPDVHCLVYNTSGSRLYAGTDGGVAVSDDNGSTWSKIFTGLSCTQFYHFGVQDDNGDIWGGAQDNGILRKNGIASSFNSYHGGDGYDVLTDMAPAGNQNDKYYSVNEHVYADAIIDEDITPPGANNFFANLAMSPTNEDIIYAGYNQLYVSYSRGSNWTQILTSSPPIRGIGGNWCVSSCPTNRKRVYTAGSDGFWRADNLDDPIEDEITSLTTQLELAGYPASNPKITDIAVSANGSNRLWVTVGGYTSGAKVFYSNSSGDNWTNISGSLPNLPVNAIVADDNDNVYAGTDIGVYYRGKNDADWTPFYNGLPRVAVSELEILTLVGGQQLLYASTYGRGIWVSEDFTACAAVADINQNLIGQQFYQASSTINSNSSLDGGAGTNVFFRAGSSITLQPGFTVNQGTEFTGYIGGCNSGAAHAKIAGTNQHILLTNNRKAARQYGFVQNVRPYGNGLSVQLNIIASGNYTLRLYDIEQGLYVDALNADLTGGSKTLTIPLGTTKSKYFRVDLCKDATILHSMDIGN